MNSCLLIVWLWPVSGGQDEVEEVLEHPVVLAKTCVLLGKRQEALDIMEAAYSHNPPDAFWSLTEADLRTLKNEPRYQELIRKINFPASTDSAPGEERSPAGASR